MELDRLRQFYHVAREGNITKAAFYLNISQPALSRCINLFEHRIGCKLFIRYAKGIKLTPEGEKIYRFASRIIEEADLLSKTVKSNALEGDLTIALSPYLSGSWLIEKLKGYLSLHPAIKLRILEHLDPCHSRDLDVIIGFEEFRTYEAVSHVLFTSSMGLYAGSSYLKKHGTPQKVEDLDTHHLISYSQPHRLPYKEKIPWSLRVGKDYGQERHPLLKVSTLDGLLNAACNHLGIIELPQGLTEIRDKNLIPVLPHLKGPTIEISFAYPQEFKDRATIKSLKEYLTRSCRKTAP